MIRLMKFILLIGMSISLVACDEIGLFNTTYEVEWLGTDNEVLGYSKVESGEVPEFNLPEEDGLWTYTGWSPRLRSINSNTTYTAVREINPNYFIGNVFQIIVFDLGNTPISTGSGFVYDEEGWFITNNHVMDEGYYAKAIFDIYDSESGEAFTKLDINLAAYNNEDKDIFIGKIDNYEKISTDYYQDFDLSTDYEVGDVTYSVGYPNSSIALDVNEGEIQRDLSSLQDKVYSGINYIGSTSFIAPGSSGGILINDIGEVLGMTTIGISNSNGDFLLGGAIEAFNYVNLLDTIDEEDLDVFGIFMHPDEYVYIGYFLEAKEHYETQEYDVRKEEIEGFVRYTYYWESEGVNSDEIAYVSETSFSMDSDMWMEYSEEYYWDSGIRRNQDLYGYYSILDELDNFTYDFKLTFDGGEYYAVTSNNINYSTNLNLTLNDFELNESYGYSATDSNIEYAKEQFNYLYNKVYEDIARFK